MNYLQYIFGIIGIAILTSIVQNYFPSYFKKKGDNLATKEDIGEITKIIESVKTEISLASSIESKKYELKYNACKNALEIIDAHMSHLKYSSQIAPLKQYNTIDATRKCHNDLILTCVNPNVINGFLNILTGTTSQPMIELDNLRNLIRIELGFGEVNYVDIDRTWLSTIIFNKIAE
jgi:uncharacterized secreted protein with C-terminal beta-propeller domain